MSVSLMMMGMMAGGGFLDYFATEAQKEFGRLGEKLNQAQIDLNLDATRLAYEQSSLQSMQQLRAALGSQVAMQAARGTDSSQGSALFVGLESETNWAADERIRKLNLQSQEASLRASGVLSSFHQMQSETQMGQQLTQRLFNTIPIGALSKSLGMGGRAPMATQGSQGYGYGMRPAEV